MKERMNWSDDERLYQPRIHSKRIRSLHAIREETGLPMTRLVDRALEEFLHCYESDTSKNMESSDRV